MVLLVGGLAACSSTPSAKKDAAIIDVTNNAQTVTGIYDPNTFSSDDMRDIAKHICGTDTIGSLAQQSEEGFTRFSVNCGAVSRYGKHVGATFYRQGPNAVKGYITHADSSGNLAQSQVNLNT
ncbi:hypothetical protein [Roseovarius albus]|uniref:hypothetical protein n=1 Tax=Roseovarius albus TaxID=1247867 RepID=UPI000A26DD4D|nr:hypothetical protein [Roseovarius albus]